MIVARSLFRAGIPGENSLPQLRKRIHYNSLLSLLIQLTESQVSLFPAILTYPLACDKAVVSLLRGQTLGNGPTALHNAV